MATTNEEIAFRILQKHGDCLQDDVPLQDLITDIADAIGAAAMPTPKQYIRDAIQQFVIDPADDEYQEGYRGGLVEMAWVLFGIHPKDVLKRADPPRQMAALTVIAGGKSASTRRNR